MEQQADTPEPVSAPSTLSREGLLATLKSWYRVDKAHWGAWQSQARRDFDFVAGEQWDAKDVQFMQSDAGGKRVPITFNRVLAIIKAVAGIEINGRHETVYLPRGTAPGAVKANELLTATSQWMADGCDAEDEQSEAFQDSLKCGMGWTESRITYDDDPNGKYVESRVSPLEMLLDHQSRMKNGTDARRLWRVRKMPLSEARLLIPGVPDDELDADWAGDLGGDKDPKPVEERRERNENTSAADEKNEVTLVEVQWWEREVYFRVASPDGQMHEFPKDKHDQLQARVKQMTGQAYPSVQQHRRVYKKAFLGKTVLGEVSTPQFAKGFTYNCITGEPDPNKGIWFGLVRVMHDPQMWANKWLTQTLHILNTTAKGGIIAEMDAFEDQRQAEATYAQPDAITWASKGAIEKKKIMQKPGIGLAAPYVNLLEFAISSIRDTSGINLELLGLRDANQPGILEAQRKQAAMTILATMFDSLRRFRKNVGRVRLFYIQTYLADGRLVRIAGQEGMQLVPLLKDKTLGDYDVIVDDAPTSPNMKQETWATLQQMIPVFVKAGLMTPDAAVACLEFSPLPSKLVDIFKAMLKQPNPKQEAQERLAVEKAKAEIEGDKAGAFKDRVSAVVDLITTGISAQQVQQDAMMGQAELGMRGQAQAADQKMRARELAQQAPQIAEDFAIQPPVGGPVLPMPPEMPMGPDQTGMQP